MTGAFPDFWVQPRDLSSRLEMPPFFIPGRGIFVYRLVVALKVVFKVIDQRYGLFKQCLVFAAVHQQNFGAKHFRYFCQDRGSPHGDQFVRKSAHCGVGSNAGKSIRAAALHADNQFGRRDGFPLKSGSIADKFLYCLDAVSDFVLTFLCHKETDPLAVIFADKFFQLVEIAVFTSEPKDQHASGIGVIGEISEDASGVVLIISHLGTSIWMREGADVVDLIRDILPGCFFNGRCHVIDTSHCGNDPDFIPDTDAAVFSSITPEKILVPFGGARRLFLS